MSKSFTIYAPTSFKEITVGQFQAYRKAMQGDFTDTRQMVITCSIFCNESIDTIESLTLGSLTALFNQVSKVLTSATSDNLQRIIEIEGVKYGFHPDVLQMTTGEFADLEEEIGDTGDVWNSLPEILSILYRPLTSLKRRTLLRKTATYSIEPYSPKHIENADKMKRIDMEIAGAVAVFFYRLGSKWLTTSRASMSEQSKMTMT
jgi:hypothetical protein